MQAGRQAGSRISFILVYHFFCAPPALPLAISFSPLPVSLTPAKCVPMCGTLFKCVAFGLACGATTGPHRNPHSRKVAQQRFKFNNELARWRRRGERQRQSRRTGAVDVKGEMSKKKLFLGICWTGSQVESEAGSEKRRRAKLDEWAGAASDVSWVWHRPLARNGHRTWIVV